MTHAAQFPVAVAHVVQNLAIGGLERVVVNLATHAHRERYAPFIVCLGPGGPLVEQARAAGVDVFVVAKKRGFTPTTVATLARRFRALGVRVVHCHNAAPLVYGALAGRLTRARVVYTAHGMKTSAASHPVRLDRLGMVDAFVTVSDDARQIAIHKGGADDSRVQTILNGVDTRAYHRASPEQRVRVRASLGLDSSAFVFVIVARLAPAKDHATLFRAFAALSSVNPSARLVVIGDGDLRDELSRLVRELRMENRILLVGMREDVSDLVAAFDCFVLSSYTEGLAMTLLEAMAAELPVVATSVGGNGEVVVDGETGLIVPARDSERLREAMQWMAAHPSEARAMGVRGRERAASSFSIEAMVNAYEDTYRRVLAGK
ncbi:MAG TPA: glycosyltransferase, partial [Candidatus Krumholzibacteria bacterium]|nr:glycosyltransferase [Candidatus Krumholzibacteria bacterium]